MLIFAYGAGGTLSLPIGYLGQIYFPHEVPEWAAAAIPRMGLAALFLLPFASYFLLDSERKLAVFGFVLFAAVLSAGLLFPG